MMRTSIILASGSPRRRELLEELGVAFEVITAAGVTELAGLSATVTSPRELALDNARMKASAVARKNPGRWVLGADTVVYLEQRNNGRISKNDRTLADDHFAEVRLFGKPCGTDEARDFLRALSGKTHEVVTACVLLGPDGQEEALDDVSRVTFRDLEEKNISRYLAAVDVMDKAGAYALQEHGDWIVASVMGSRSNVIGLPTEKLGELLRSRNLA